MVPVGRGVQREYQDMQRSFVLRRHRHGEPRYTATASTTSRQTGVGESIRAVGSAAVERREDQMKRVSLAATARRSSSSATPKHSAGRAACVAGDAFDPR